MSLLKDQQHRDRRYLDLLRTRACIITGRYGHKDAETVDPAHLVSGGKGLKCHDYWAVPLIHSLHLETHNHGQKAIQIRAGFTLNSLVRIHLSEAYPDTFQGLTPAEVPYVPLSDFIFGLKCVAKAEYDQWVEHQLPPFGWA